MRRETDCHLSFVIDRDEHYELNELAKREGPTAAEFSRRALNYYLTVKHDGVLQIERRTRGRRPKER